MKVVAGKPGAGIVCCLLYLSFTCTPLKAATLTLEAALSFAELAHPVLKYTQSERDMALAELSLANARGDTQINLEGILRNGKPSTGSPGLTSDNSVRLTARKTLYDFGRSSKAEIAAEYELKARDADLTTTLDQRRLEIMARYFDVLLADKQYTVDNELMSVHYVSFDHAKDLLERGQISSVELAELESRYHDTLQRRNASAIKQRITRALLANAMNRPGDLPSDLEEPMLSGNQRILPDYETLLPMMMSNNSRLLARQELISASRNRLESLRADKRPVLDAEIQAADYSREASTRDNLSAGLILTWPLYQGNRTDSRIARELAQFNMIQAGFENLKMELTQTLLETYLDITELQSTARSAARKYVEFSDLVLERSRALYELELKSNLGTSMVETSAASLRERQIEYSLALGIARLEALVGKALDDPAN